MFKSSRFLLAFLIGFLVFPFNSYTQQEISEPIPLNSKIIKGQLKNGLTYYILENKMPENKAELRLVVNTGSLNEDDNQQGLAHMAEHMAFNGTKNFEKNEIVSFLQSIGVAFGNDLNAYTSFNETVYILPIPLQDDNNLKIGLQVLEEWAHRVSFKDEDINEERGIILEESRMGKGATDRMFRQIYPRIFEGSKYANRLPIGKDSIIQTFHPDLIRKFYKDWYRPDLMAVIVVGDVNATEVEKMIKKQFKKIKRVKNPRPLELEKIHPYSETSALVVTDHEATGYTVSIAYSFQPTETLNTTNAYKTSLIENLYKRMLSQRLQELVQKEDPPFLGASAGFNEFTRGFRFFSLDAGIGTGNIQKGLNALLTEMERVKRYGFTQPELERAKKSALSYYEQAFNNRDKTNSAVLVEELIKNFLENESVPGIEKEFEMVKAMLPEITLDEINKAISWFNTHPERFVFVMGPDAEEGSLIGSKDILSSIAAIEKATIQPYTETLVEAELLTELPKPGKVVSREKEAVLGTTLLQLSNSVKVTLKPTQFKNDQILMAASRYGGKNNYGVEDKYNAEYAVPIVTTLGVGNFSPADLRKLLAGKTVSVSPSLTGTTEGVRGSSGNKDIETMLQLTYLYFTSPRKDTSLFNSFIQRNKLQYANIGANPQVAFLDTMYAVLFQQSPLAPVTIPKPSFYDNVNLNRALEIYSERFSDANGMHFVFTGSFNEEELIPLLEQYLGGLPSRPGSVHNYTDNKLRPVSGKKSIQFHKGQEKQSLIVAMYNGETKFSPDMQMKIEAMSEILNIRIIEELREKVQGIYGGGTSGNLNRVPYEGYSFILQLPCGPEKADTLLKVVKSEFQLIKDEGPSVVNLNKVKEQWKEAYKTNIQDNSFWLNNILSNIMNNTTPDRFINYEKYVDALTVQDIQEAARLVFGNENEFIAILMPENN